MQLLMLMMNLGPIFVFRVHGHINSCYLIHLYIDVDDEHRSHFCISLHGHINSYLLRILSPSQLRSAPWAYETV